MTTQHILDATAAAFNVTVAGLRSDKRDQQHTWARQAAMLLIRHLMPWLSATAIGRELGKDHTTVLWGIHAAKERGRQRAYLAYQQTLLQLARELRGE